MKADVAADGGKISGDDARKESALAPPRDLLAVCMEAGIEPACGNRAAGVRVAPRI